MDLNWHRANAYFKSRPALNLGEPARAYRRNLLVALGVFCVYWGAGIKPNSVSAVFASGSIARPWLIEVFLFAIVVYEFFMFHTARMAAEVHYLNEHEDTSLYRYTVTRTVLTSLLHQEKFSIEFTDEVAYRIEKREGLDHLVGTFTVKSASRYGMGHNTHDAVAEIKARALPGLNWLEGGAPYKIEFEAQEANADSPYLKKAFPRLRRLRLASFMELGFPYVGFFAVTYGWTGIKIWAALKLTSLS